MSTYYPVVFPLIALRKMKDIIASGELIAERQELMKCWWLVEGFSYRTFLGDPHEPSSYSASFEEGTEAEFKDVCYELAGLCGREMDRGEMETWKPDRYLSMVFASVSKFMHGHRMKLLP